MAAEAEATREARAKVRTCSRPSHALPVSGRSPLTHPVWPFPCPPLGDRCRGRDERVPRSEGGVPCDRRVPVCPAAPLLADSQHHRGREELYHHLPSAHGRHVTLHEKVTHH